MPLPWCTTDMQQLLRISASMFEPTGKDLIGLECEWPVRDWQDPTSRPDMERLLGIADRELPGAGRITIEPGGQIELSSFPAPCLSDALDAVNGDTDVLHHRLLAVGLDSEDIALDHTRGPVRILQQPRYAAMQSFFDAGGPAGRWMMCNTASVQVNVSNESCDPLRRWRTLSMIAPALLAAFANSRGVDASGIAWASLRQGIWGSIDPGRTRPVTLDDDPAHAWLEYALAADVLYILQEDSGGSNGTAIAPGLSFGEWMDRGHELGFPTADDFRYHLSTLFPPVRPRGWMELRVLDALPRAIRTAAAVCVAVAVQAEVAADIERLVPDVSHLHREAAQYGLAHPLIAEAASALMDITTANVDCVSSRSDHTDALPAFVERYTARGLTPGDESWCELPIALLTKDLRGAARTS